MTPKDFIHILRTQVPFATDPVLRATPVIGMDAGVRFRQSHKKFFHEWGVDDLIPRPVKVRVLERVLRRWARREVVPIPVPGQGGGNKYELRPVWGPFPLRGYTGPRSLL